MDATFLQNLLPSGLEFQCTRCEFDGRGITVEGAVLASYAVCPECGHSSEKVHGHYTRRIQDLPCGKTTVAYVITARTFVCQNQNCMKSIFCERLSGLAAPHARTTETLSQSHQSIGFALGGLGGARLAEQLGKPTAVCLRSYPGWGENSYQRGGPCGGFLGGQYEPTFALCNPRFDWETVVEVVSKTIKPDDEQTRPLAPGAVGFFNDGP